MPLEVIFSFNVLHVVPGLGAAAKVGVNSPAARTKTIATESFLIQ